MLFRLRMLQLVVHVGDGRHIIIIKEQAASYCMGSKARKWCVATGESCALHAEYMLYRALVKIMLPSFSSVGIVHTWSQCIAYCLLDN